MSLGNMRSLPHDSKNGHHLDLYTFVEGQVKPEKFHQIIDGSKVQVNSIEALRQRLGSTKGY